MSHNGSIEERLENLERDVFRLKRQLTAENTSKNWIEEITGSFENDRDFEEIARLGREIRQAERPDDRAEE